MFGPSREALTHLLTQAQKPKSIQMQANLVRVIGSGAWSGAPLGSIFAWLKRAPKLGHPPVRGKERRKEKPSGSCESLPGGVYLPPGTIQNQREEGCQVATWTCEEIGNVEVLKLDQ